jgi:hypothetical protein
MFERVRFRRALTSRNLRFSSNQYLRNEFQRQLRQRCQHSKNQCTGRTK